MHTGAPQHAWGVPVRFEVSPARNIGIGSCPAADTGPWRAIRAQVTLSQR